MICQISIDTLARVLGATSAHGGSPIIMWVACSCLLAHNLSLFHFANTTTIMTKPDLPALVSILRRGETYRSLRRGSIYEPIPEGEYIRLLELRPGRGSDDIDCSLRIVDIESAKATYEAISYVWGDFKSTVNIWCNGLRVSITVSLADALRNFRHKSEARVLWADALCINQRDDREKGHQVKRMGEVYANAKRTLVWLGCDEYSVAEHAFLVILEANAYFAASFLRAGQKFHRMAPLMRPYPICMDESTWLGVATLFKFLWFRRVWTVQEAAIAKECRLYWGPVSIDIADVLEISIWMVTNVIRSIVGNLNTLSIGRITLYLYYNIHQPERWQRSRIGLTYLATRTTTDMFTTVIQAARYLEASDPRDHVYAFLGCPSAIDSKGRTLVEADYTIPMNDLNLRLAYALVKNPAEGPFALSSVRHDSRDKVLDNMHPSWVPAWHAAGKSRMTIANSTYWFQAGGTRQRFTATQYGKNRLRVGACPFDTVIWRSSAIRPYSSTSGLNGTLIDLLWDDVVQRSSQLGITIRQPDFLRSLMIGYPASKGPSTTSDGRQQSVIDAYRRSISVARTSDSEAVVMSPRDRHDAAMFGTGLQDLCNASIFLTTGGRIGLAPRGDLVKLGDVCCIVFGATVPFLLTPSRKGRYKLISDCYIHGVMNDEIMEGFCEIDLNEQSIVLE